MRPRLLCFFVAVLALFHSGSFALAEKRLALLIGNTNYAPQVGALTNPGKDVDLVGKALTDVGFEIVTKKDVGRAAILQAISTFVDQLSGAGPDAAGFFYYSGHGAARPRDAMNYLIPIDVLNMQDETMWWNAVPLSTILDELEKGAPNAKHIVVFDACRNELHLPFKTAVKGFAPVTDRNGIFIAYSTSPNTTSSDVGVNSGPYAQVLASELVRPGQDQLALFQNVKERVFTLTGNTQRPWENNGLLTRFYFNGKPAPVNVPGIADEAKRTWEAFGSKSLDPKFLEDFIALYGNTQYGEPARKRYSEIQKASPAALKPDGKPGATFSSNLIRAIVPNSDSYSSGETIKIKIITSSSLVKAFAVFPFGAKERAKVEAGYSEAEGGLYVPFRVPANTKPGTYIVLVYVQEIRSKLEERHEIEIEIR